MITVTTAKAFVTLAGCPAWSTHTLAMHAINITNDVALLPGETTLTDTPLATHRPFTDAVHAWFVDAEHTSNVTKRPVVPRGTNASHTSSQIKTLTTVAWVR